ncbi:MAG: 1-deoxy-D-xylulose-5-phosphate reductoisomerase [Firmicutes bacterium]|nr:1-deoxy-D-xylulose-5-phosphate reductoisomerase [Bacillota bacterium]
MRKISILGSTGSIGTQALDVIRMSHGEYEVSALVCGSSIEKIRNQIKEFKPGIAVVAKEEDAAALQGEFKDIRVLWGDDGIISAATCDCDLVINSLVGIRGMVPTYHAIMAGKDVALANKETLVAGGQVIMKAVSDKGIKLTPRDSEHSAIFQCMQGERREDISKLIITCSGGPFRGYGLEELKSVTLADTLKHPRWDMGKKITVDSATLRNKGFELIEAKWLFDFSPENIEIVVHPQSIIHSMIEMCDGGVIAQMGVPDMKLPISYALTHPARIDNVSQRLDFFSLEGGLTFEKPDRKTFRCLAMAEEAIKEGGTAPAVLNGANEVLVSNFLKERISFIDIQNILEEVMNRHVSKHDLSIEVILEEDRWARDLAEALIAD